MGEEKAKNGVRAKDRANTCEHLWVDTNRCAGTSQYCNCIKHNKRLGKLGEMTLRDDPEEMEYKTDYDCVFPLPSAVVPCIQFGEKGVCPIEEGKTFPDIPKGCFGMFVALGTLLTSGICGLMFVITGFLR